MPNRSHNVRNFFILFILGVLVLFVLSFNSRLSRLRYLETEADALGTQVTLLEQTQAALDQQITYATSDGAVEEWAYEEGRMIRQGDHLIVPLPSGEVTPTPQAGEVRTSPRLRNWEIWKFLFFDPLSP